DQRDDLGRGLDRIRYHPTGADGSGRCRWPLDVDRLRNAKETPFPGHRIGWRKYTLDRSPPGAVRFRSRVRRGDDLRLTQTVSHTGLVASGYGVAGLAGIRRSRRASPTATCACVTTV